MKKPFARRLSALLVICMLLIPAALAEEIPAAWEDAEIAEAEQAFYAGEAEADEAQPETYEAQLETYETQFEENEAQTEAYGARLDALYEPEGSIPIHDANFPDATFRAYISNLSVDGGATRVGDDGWLSPAEVSLITEINLQGQPVASLVGIQYLTSLQYLFCMETSIASLDVTGLSKLVYIACDFCPNLSSLTLGNLWDLEGLGMVGCDKLTAVDVSGCYKLMQNIAGRKPVEITATYGSRQVTFYRWGWTTDTESHSIEYNPNTQLTISEVDVEPVYNPIPATKKKSSFKVTAYPGDVYRLEPGNVVCTKFKSSAKKVAKVDSKGVVTIVGPGKTTLSFKVGKVTRQVTLTVADATLPTRVMLSVTGTQSAKVGQTVTLYPVIDAGVVTGYTWSSSNKKVATVKNGVITFKKPGKVTITCTAVRGKKKARLKFTVSK